MCSSHAPGSAADRTRSASGARPTGTLGAGSAGLRARQNHVRCVPSRVVAGAPRRRQPLDHQQAPAVAGRTPVPAPGLGEVQLQRPGAAVADADDDLRLARPSARPRTRCPRAAPRSRRARSRAARPCRPVVGPGVLERVLEHATGPAGGAGIGRQPHPPLELNGHVCSLPCRPDGRGAARPFPRPAARRPRDFRALARGHRAAAMA